MKKWRGRWFVTGYIRKLYRGWYLLPAINFYYAGAWDRGFRIQVELSWFFFSVFIGKYDQ